MMHGPEKSDPSIVAAKPTNKAGWLIMGFGVMVPSALAGPG